jgi:hypothetical protein
MENYEILAEKFNFNISNTTPLNIIFTAQSKVYFYCKDAICEYVFKKGMLPINPFMVFNYFLNDRVDRDLIRRANNNLIKMCNELWVFGDVANGVMFEIVMAKKLNIPIKYFTIATRSEEIFEITVNDLIFETEMNLTDKQINEFKQLII